MNSSRSSLFMWIGIGLCLAVAGCRLLDDQFRVVGTVQAGMQTGGVGIGCWRVLSTDSIPYEPTNLPPEFQVIGLEVSMVVEPATSSASFCPTGNRVDVVSIAKR
jgi:hypothetical protein